MPHNRFKPNSKRLPAIYCSTKCIKRASYLRRNPNVKSIFRDKSFWNTETGIGFKWERYIAKLIGANHIKFNKLGVDLEKDGLLIDVKASNLYKRKRKNGKVVNSDQSGVWVFNRNKEKKVDFFFCVCLINNKVNKILKIPSNKFSTSGITIGIDSKYDKFIFMG